MSVYPIILVTAMHTIIMLCYVLLRFHTIRCLNEVKQDKPVQRRFSKHRDKGMALLLVAILPISLLLLCIPYQLLAGCFGLSVQLQGEYSVGAVFIAYPLLYILWELFTLWKYRQDYNDYCAGYSVRQMNEWAAYLPDDPVRFHREAKRLNRFLLWFGILLIIGSLIWSIFDLTEHTEPVESSFLCSASDPRLGMERGRGREAVVGPLVIILGCCLALEAILHGVKRRPKKDRIQVTDGLLAIYKDWTLVDTVGPADVSEIIACPVRTRFGLTGGHITLYGVNRQELITVQANAEDIDLVIDLVGREKLLVKM